VLEWLNGLPRKSYAKAFVRIERLSELGEGLRRPEAEYLGESIYELRWRFQSVNYRILYFFHGEDLVVLTHSLTKEKRIPKREIGIAIQRKEAFEANPEAHIYYMED
jgi:phage-related protein